MVPESIRVLLIEEDENYFILTQAMLRDAVRELSLVEAADVCWAADAAAGCSKLGAECFDVVLLDINIADGNGMQLFLEVNEAARGIPVLLLTGIENQLTAVKAVQAGAQDFHIKGRVDGGALLRSIIYSIERQAMYLQLKRANNEIIRSSAELAMARARAQDHADELTIQAAKLAIAQKKALEATRQKSQFLANMSHEVRTPLTAIVGFAESVLYHGLSENEQKKALHTVLKNSSHMLELINDILDFSKIEAGKLDVEIIDCSVLEILSDVQALMQQKAASKGLKLEMHYRCPIPEVIQSDPTRFKQILINLVSNAVKFTESGSVHLNVSCDTRRETLLIEVVDTGIGLTEEQRDKLFEAYIQADPSTARQFGGTGLGLNVSKKLAAALGGSIAVASAAGQGSTFSLELSTGSLERVRMIDEPDIRQWSMEETFSASENSLQRPYGVPQLEGRVLLAEDVKDNQDLISMLIAKTGAGVKVAENGLLALEAAKQESFDLILMDMQMPVMGGCAAIANIRQSGYSGSIVSLTADNACVKKKTCVGCTNYLRKPFSHEEFYTMLSANLPVSGQVQLDGQRAADAPMFSSMIEDDPDYAPIILRFVDRLPVRIDKLDTAYKEGDWDELKAEAHKLASGELFGYPELTKVARELELAAAEQLSEQAASAIGAVSNLSSAIIAGRESLVRSISA